MQKIWVESAWCVAKKLTIRLPRGYTTYTMIVAVIILGVVCLVLTILFVMQLRRSDNPADASSALLLKEDLSRISDDITKLKDSLQSQITERMDKNQELMRESIMKQFGASSRLITDVTERLTKLDETNKRVVNVADELRTLQNVLQNPKQRGVLGEYYLTNGYGIAVSSLLVSDTTILSVPK